MSEAALEIPPSEQKAINEMADKFKGAMGQITKPPPEAPDPAAPPEQRQPGEVKSASREQFKKLEAIRDQYKSEAEALKPRLATLEAELATVKPRIEEADKIKNEHERLTRELAERDTLLKQFVVEKHPAFQRHFSERLSAAVSEAKEAGGADYAADIEEILQAPPSTKRDNQIALLSEELSDYSRTALVNSYTELKRIERERQVELDKAPENWKILQEHAARRAEAEQTKLIRERALLLNHVAAQIEPDLANADPALAKSIRGNVERFIKGEADAESYVQTVTAAAKWQRYAKEKDELIEKLQAQLGELQSAQPSLSGGSQPPKLNRELEDIGVKFRRLRDGGRVQPGQAA